MAAIDRRDAASLRFRDARRPDSRSFVEHLGPKHQFRRTLIVSGDRESQVQYLAREVGVTEVHAEQTPEQKLALVRAETALAPTLYIGDGINDAPAMMAAAGYLTPVGGAVLQEVIDVMAVLNALRAAFPPATRHDF